MAVLRAFSNAMPQVGGQDLENCSDGGNMTGAANSAGAYTISYDKMNRASVVQEPFGLTLTFDYGAVGNRTQVQDSRNGLESFSYDADNRMTHCERSAFGKDSHTFPTLFLPKCGKQ